MKNNIQEFNAAVAKDSALQAKLQSIHAEAGEFIARRMVKLGQDAGMPFTTEEFLSKAAEAHQDLSDEQLEDVAGGGSRWTGWDAGDPWNIAFSVISAGMVCAITAIASSAKPEITNCQPKDW